MLNMCKNNINTATNLSSGQTYCEFEASVKTCPRDKDIMNWKSSEPQAAGSFRQADVKVIFGKHCVCAGVH